VPDAEATAALDASANADVDADVLLIR